MSAVSQKAKDHRREQARAYSRAYFRKNPGKRAAAIAKWRHAHPEHNVWMKMLQRCNNSEAQDFAYYGGRGITVCARCGDYSREVTSRLVS